MTTCPVCSGPAVLRTRSSDSLLFHISTTATYSIETCLLLLVIYTEHEPAIRLTFDVIWPFPVPPSLTLSLRYK